MQMRKRMSTRGVFMLLVLSCAGTLSVSAQYYLNLWRNDGSRIEYAVPDIEKVSFSTTKLPAFKAEYVDLGLSVQWATCNLGSIRPAGYGTYHAWGEIADKTSSKGYKWYDRQTKQYTKYVVTESLGTLDMKYRLDPEDDVAHVCDGEWRIPTLEEMRELKDSCDWIPTDSNGVGGYLVKSRKNDNSIFLPASGFILDDDPLAKNEAGFYITSTMNTRSGESCFRLSCYVNGTVSIADDSRSFGYSVRPVFSSKFEDNEVNAVSLSLDEVDARIESGQQFKLEAEYKIDKENVELFPSWTTSNPSVAIVSNTGMVVGVSEGTCNITARIGDVSRSCKVTVRKAEDVMEPVDLGLSIQWASCNIGASHEEYVGGFYAWGETEKKDSYSLQNYKWINASDTTLKKYCNNHDIGYNGLIDNLLALEAEDDAAQKLWGGYWRMPTNEEVIELIENCDITAVNKNGVDVFKFTSKINGDSIFLPMNSAVNETRYNGAGVLGYYWTSDISIFESMNAYSMFLMDGGLTPVAQPTAASKQFESNRYVGMGIRPVYADPDAFAKKELKEVYYNFAKNITGSSGIYVAQRALFNYSGDDVRIAGYDIKDQIEEKELDLFIYSDSNVIVSDAYNRFYNSIIETNKLIAKYKDGYDGAAPTAVMNRVVAEARVLRAYMHMMLAIGWGTPPLMDFVPDESTILYNCDKDPRGAKSHNELLEWCAQECLDVVSVLDERENTQDKDGAYKVTKGFAYSVAGKAYVMAGKYDLAKTALNEVIESKKYALVPGDRYWENFHVEGDGNEEKIFEPNLEYDPNIGAWGGNTPIFRSTWMEANEFAWRATSFVKVPYEVYSGFRDGWGGLAVPDEFSNEFFENDGHSYRFDASLIRIDDAVYNMTYNDATINNMPLEEKKTSGVIGLTQDGLYGQSFYLPKKMLQKASDLTLTWGNNVGVNNYTIMRYAEVLLLYAEACLQTDDEDGALEAINQIQERAGAPVSLSVDMDVLRTEKKFELWLESSRWADLVRWGDTDGVKQAGQTVTTLYDKLSREPQLGEDVTWLPGENASTGRFYMVTTDEAVQYFEPELGFKEDKNELLPYPASVLKANPNMEQNPGWE